MKELDSSTSPRMMMRASLLDRRPAPRRVVVPSSPRRVETGGFFSSAIRSPPCWIKPCNGLLRCGDRIAFSEDQDEISPECRGCPGAGGLHRGPASILPDRGRERHG